VAQRLLTKRQSQIKAARKILKRAARSISQGLRKARRSDVSNPVGIGEPNVQPAWREGAWSRPYRGDPERRHRKVRQR
jgi:hypothetical protein